MTLDLLTIRAAILDMDGVLWRGEQVLPGVAEFFAFLQQRHIPFLLATNNSTRTVTSYVARLRKAGVPAQPQHVITSAVATADYVQRHYPTETPVYIIGQEGIRQALAEHGFREDPENARLVVVGMDFHVTYAKLKTATLRIRAGADFIGTNGDRTFPIPEGLAPGNGSILAALQAATDVEPLIIGKPQKPMFEMALARLNTAPEHTLMIGDRLETDIVGAQNAGIRTALVLTGITTPEHARAASPQPDGVFASLAALHADWQAALDTVETFRT